MLLPKTDRKQNHHGQLGDVLNEMGGPDSETACLRFQVVVELGRFERKKSQSSNSQDGHKDAEGELKRLNPFPAKEEALALAGRTKVDAGRYPIVLWWSPLTGETGRLGQCGADACFFTINRTFQHHPMTKAFLFYGESGFPFLL